MATLTSRNPYTGETNASFETLSDAELLSTIEQSNIAYQTRRHTSASEKKALFLRMADLLDERNEECAKLETIEMGMLYSASKAGLRNTANLIRWNANNFERILADEVIYKSDFSPLEKEGSGEIGGHIQYDARGVIFGIAPWNFPFNQLLRAAVPNIIAGNTVIYKHASNVPLCLQAIEKLFIDTGFPAHVFTKLFVTSSQSEMIIAHDAIQGVNITGSDFACSEIGSLASKYLKPSVTEGGGNDAFLLLDHKDMDDMAAKAANARCSFGGQKCNSSKRFIILEKDYDAFVEKFATAMNTLVVGDPMNPTTQVPPLSSLKLLKDIDTQVQKSLADGARLVCGGKILDESKNLYAPTILADVTPSMTSYREEIFGPVASVIKAKDINDAIRLANLNDYALSASVWGDNLEQCKTVARQLEGGMIFVNAPAGSKASLPFGGVKKSGYGKENGPDGLKSFTNRKVVLY